MQAVPVALGPDLAHNLAQHLSQFVGRLPASVATDRRRDVRVAIPWLLSVAPLNAEPSGEVLTAVGKDLSRHGIGFFHSQPLPHRRVVLTFEDARLERLSVEVELNRCRFSNLGWYESGGRLLRLAEPPAPHSLAG